MFERNVIVLVVSREILEGCVVDRNGPFIASRVDDIGYRVRTIQVVDRVEAELVAALRWSLEQQADYVIVTGGLGPNWDDTTRACLAKAAGLPLTEDPCALSFVQQAYTRLAARDSVHSPELTEGRRNLARVPKGSLCFENTVGTAPAVQLRVGDRTVFLLPGIPAEMQRFFTQHVMPTMVASGPATVRGERQVDCQEDDEADLAQVLPELARKHPGIGIRTRVQGTPPGHTIRIVLVAEHENAVRMNELLDLAERDLRGRLGHDLRSQPTDASAVDD